MALQDLTPQLRTRLSRLERLVGWFVTLAILLLLVGLGYYVYQLAERKGWFLTKMPYFTFVRDAAGLSVGDRVKLMGFDAGEIMEITPMPPENPYFNVYIRFRVNEPYYGYLWDDSRARIGAADFLGHRFIEVTKGTNGVPTYALHAVLILSVNDAMGLVGGTNNYIFVEDFQDATKTNTVVHASEPLSRDKLQMLSQQGVKEIQIIDLNSKRANPPQWIYDEKNGKYVVLEKHPKGYWLHADESPALTERLEKVVNTVETALPDFLALTNKLVSVLTNANNIVTHADELMVSAKPILSNVTHITANLTNRQGALGEWLLPTNLNQQLGQTLGTANSTLNTAQTNLNAISGSILVNLQNLAGITSNLNAQVQGNSLVLTEISDLISHTDEVVQGLKRFWLLKGAFREGTNQPMESILQPRIGGKK